MRCGDGTWDVVVCRGCCCGSARKHRRTDHGGQVRALREAAAQAGTRVVVADCLDRCQDSNVVVLRPDRAARRAGARPVWLGGVLSADQTRALCDWLRTAYPAGGPASLPASLAPLLLRRR